MNGLDPHSSLSSYGDPRYSSSASLDTPKPPPAKILLDGYRDALDPQNGKNSPYNLLNRSHHHSSALTNPTDPVVMYLLSEIAIGDSKNYEILSLETVDDLKKEHSRLSSRLAASKRKLALEMKLRDAAKSLNRLYNSKSPRSSEGFDSTGSPKSQRGRSSKFGRTNGDKPDDELAVATRKCEDLALEVWRLEYSIQQVQRKLLEHTAGILQMTHKGLKKNPKNNLPRTPDSIYSGNRGSVDGFDNRSLYKTLDNLDEFGGRDADDINGPGARETVEKLAEMSSQLHSLMTQVGLSRSPTLPPPDKSSGLQDQLSYLNATVGSLQSSVAGLLDQKSILTTQIQQQRELNSKSDAERDAHAANLVEQLATTRKELELSERENQSMKEELNLVLDQLETVRHDLAATGGPETLASEKEARLRAEEDIQRLESQLDQFRSHANAQAEEEAEGRERAEKQVSELEVAMQQLRTESDARVREASDMHARLEAQLKDATEARIRAEEDSARRQAEMSELEGEVARAQTELTMVKAELDGAYGSRAQRAAEVASNPAVQKQIDDLKTKNTELTDELTALKAGPVNSERMQMLEKELREMTDEYEAMIKASIEFEKDRERLDGIIDGLRDRCEQLETQISEDRINSMGLSSPSSAGRDGTSETTSTMVLKNEFKKMMRDTRAENMRILKAEQEERKRLEAVLRALRKEHGKLIQSQNATTS